MNILKELPGIIGWVGTGTFLMAYWLLSIEKLKGNHPVYQLMNVIGGLCLVINALAIGDGPTLILNFAWMCIGLFALWRISTKSDKT